MIIELHDWLLPSQGNSLPFLQCVSRLDRDFVYIGEHVYSIANDLEQCVARTGQSKAARRPVSPACTPITLRSLEEPLDQELAAAMNDFQTEIRIVRHTDDELRVAHDVLNAEKEHLLEALASERSAGQAAQQTLTTTQAEYARAQEELIGVQRRLRSTQEELASTRRELGSRQQGLALALQDLGSAQQVLSHTLDDLAGAHQELQGLQAREKSLVNDCSLAIDSLQHLRNQLHKRDRSLAAMQRRSDSMAMTLATQRRAFATKAARLNERLHHRNRELAAIREQRLVRLAMTVGNRMRQWRTVR